MVLRHTELRREMWIFEEDGRLERLPWYFGFDGEEDERTERWRLEIEERGGAAAIEEGISPEERN